MIMIPYGIVNSIKSTLDQVMNVWIVIDFQNTTKVFIHF